MSRWSRRAVAAAAVVLAAMAAASGPVGAGADPPPAPPGGVTTTTFADNDFIPRDVNLSDCISGVPRPGCGSEARGGWRQGLVFVAMAAGMSFIAWRIFRSARKRPSVLRDRPDADVSKGQNDEDAVVR